MKLFQFLQKPFRNLTKLWQENYVFFREFKYFYKAFILAVTCSLLASTFDGFGIGLLFSFLQSLIHPHLQSVQTGIHWFDIYILGIHTTKNVQFVRLSTLIILVTWLRSGILYVQNFSIGIVEFTLTDRLRKQVFDRLNSLKLSYFSQTRSGELINSFTTEISKLKYSFSLIAGLMTDGIKLPVYGFALFLISWKLSLVAIFSLSLLSVGLSILRRSVRSASLEISKANGNFTSVAVEFLSGIFTVHAFATHDFEQKRFYQASSEIVSSEIKSLSISRLIEPLARAIGITILIILILLGFFFLNISVAGLLTFIFILRNLVDIVQSLNRRATQISYFQGSFDNIKKLLTVDSKHDFINGNIKFLGLKQSIELVSVGFSYQNEISVLSQITLTIDKGKMTAIVGSSGAGKSTLASLILRFYDPQQGQILIDGIELQKFEIASLRCKIAIVSQETFIFNTSVKNNISYGSAEYDEATICQVAQLANALEFIVDLPEGFETQLGDRGVKLSGGQRQRIAIARALLRDPEILILDEATSALDSASEQLIQEALEQLLGNRTVIAIAHRLSTIAKADRVIVLEQGRIVEQGSYEELIQQKGKLWYYHQLQNG